jgi:hypothetical protein
MALPISGSVSASQIKTIIGLSGELHFNNSDARYLANNSFATDVPVKASDWRGKPVSGFHPYVYPGPYSYMVNAYQTLEVFVNGAGGGGGGGSYFFFFITSQGGNGSPGVGSTTFGAISADPGTGGGAGSTLGGTGGSGTPGGASGGDTNTTGGALNGGPGGSGNGGGWGGPGGNGGLAYKAWQHGISSGYPQYASSIQVTVIGAGGSGGNKAPCVFNGLVCADSGTGSGTPGGDGSVFVRWK